MPPSSPAETRASYVKRRSITMAFSKPSSEKKDEYPFEITMPSVPALGMRAEALMPRAVAPLHKDMAMQRERSSVQRERAPTIRPAAHSIVAAQRLAKDRWLTLFNKLAGKTLTVTLNTKDRLVIGWEQVPGVLAAGSCDAIHFPMLKTPAEYGTHLVLATMLVALIEEHGDEVDARSCDYTLP